MSSSDVMSNLMSQYQGEDGNLTGIPQEKLLEAIMTLQNMKNDTSHLKPKKGRKTKASKDPNRPKRPKSAYFLWLDENRGRIKEELGEDAKVTEVSKEAGRQWKLVTAEEKAPFEETSNTEKQRYKAEMETYQPSEPVVVYSVEEYPKAPEGWSGPFQMKYLSKNAKNAEGKILKFKNFDEAVEAANKLETCGGITKTSRGYDLRIGPDLISNPESKASSGLASWIKGQPEALVAMTETSVETKVVKKTKGKAKATTKAPDVFGEDSDEEEEAEEIVTKPKAEKPKSSPKKKAFKTKEPEPEPEPEPEEDSESEDEELDVTEVVIKGKTYFKTEKGTLYDPDSSDVVGEDGELFE